MILLLFKGVCHEFGMGTTHIHDEIENSTPFLFVLLCP